MKRLFFIVLGVSVALVMLAAPQSITPQVFKDVNGNNIKYLCNTDLKTAEVAYVTEDDVTGGVYPRKNFIIHNTVALEQTGQTMGGATGTITITMDVVGFGENAFYKAKATSITFPTSGKFTYIRKQGMAEMKNMKGTLTLPDGLKEIDEKGIFSGTEGGQMPVTKLVIPASVDTLGMSAVVLNQVEEIEFLGTTPPKIYNDGNGVLPWTISATSAYNTPKDIKITVPDGAEANYKAAAGIGDYFDCFSKETPTALDNMRKAVAPATKSLRNGMLIIERNGVRYDVQGKQL